MNYNETNELLERIVNAQKILATSPPTLPKDPLYIFLRILFYITIILGIAVCVTDCRKKSKLRIKQEIFINCFKFAFGFSRFLFQLLFY